MVVARILVEAKGTVIVRFNRESSEGNAWLFTNGPKVKVKTHKKPAKIGSRTPIINVTCEATCTGPGSISSRSL
jgi:hypothetical protein